MYQKTKVFMQKIVDDKQISGISYAFIEGNQLDLAQVGWKQTYPKLVELEEDTLYDMASLTKVICTNTVILKLIEAQKIKINEPLNLYLPEFLDKKVTIEELLTHTSGINPFIPNRNELSKEELKAAILMLKSDNSRGKVVKYTDTGTILLGFLIEKMYAKSVQDVFMNEVIIPLDMLNSGFKNIQKRKAAPTENRSDRGLVQGEVHDPKAFVLGENCGSAGLFSTLSDTITFVEMMLRKGQHKNKMFLKPESIDLLLNDYTKNCERGRSLGWDIISYEERFLLYHTGYTGTFIIMDLKMQGAFIFLSNRIHPVDKKKEYLEIRDELVAIYLAEKKLI
ncbi:MULTISPECIES: serine hydrolase [Vagococcus]|uniref:Beta-lactamase class C and other penicillin binding proteins n=1 Tax=Vagococcus fluvialis bH819 TaxID=1255619 RepID=A0A1X6WSE4_9ENTE|nr:MULTISPECIES: serine hydrolase [Vagococcus]SLM87187.1 Beta-lactamase class C and other penicillin binding proteins [Vagococcus fluvialis bH819]HCM90079.1 serine hydrolase [Vagococcus sp.]